MSLIQKLREDQIYVRKHVNELVENKSVVNSLTTLIGEAAMIGKNDGNRETTDEEVIAVVKKFIKGNKELMELTKPTSNTYISAQDENELLANYLPQQLDEDELRAIITPLAEGKDMKAMGGIMKELKTNYTGLYDGGVASSIIKSLLQ